jgi:hypothetical protein
MIFNHLFFAFGLAQAIRKERVKQKIGSWRKLKPMHRLLEWLSLRST